MSAPKRWLDDAGDALDGERDVLRTGLSMDPPPDAQGEVWAALLAKIPPPAAPPPGDGGASATKAAASAAKSVTSAAGAKASATAATAVGGGLLKSALIGAGSAALLVAGYTAVTPSTPDPVPTAITAIAIAPATNAPVPLRATATPLPTTSAEAPPKQAPAEPKPAAAPPPTPSAEPVVERETMLREESRLVAEARDALRRGDGAGALVMLDQIRARFPKGVLSQEREALSIEALARSGRRDEASARAAAFVEAHPSSPLAARVQSFMK